MVSSTETIKAIAVASGYSTSAAGSASYAINLPATAPTFSPAAGAYTSAQAVTLGTPTHSAAIYYTTNGSTPTTSSPVYSGSVMVSSSETIKAIAVASGYSTSAAGSASYTINMTAANLPAATPTQTPTFSPDGGTYTRAETVRVSASRGALNANNQFRGVYRIHHGLLDRDDKGHCRDKRRFDQCGCFGQLHH
jgi:hypothetical protein